MPGNSPRLGKSEKTLVKYKKEGAVNAPPCYADAREVAGETTMRPTLEVNDKKRMMPKRARGPPRLCGETIPIILGTEGLGLRLRGMS